MDASRQQYASCGSSVGSRELEFYNIYFESSVFTSDDKLRKIKRKI